ncbi:MAG: PilZ domain-containing protein [Oligoflexus sp.]
MTVTTLKILSIDEKRITTDLDKAGYRKVGAQIFQATSFRKAEEILQEGEIDVIVINYDYKDVDAEAICEHLKRNPATQEKPVVFTSVQSLPRKVLDKQFGPDLFIEQPIPRQYFIEKIRNVMEQKIRDTERVTHVGSVSFVYEDKNYECVIQDISKSGILMATDLDLKPGYRLDMSFDIPGYKKPIRVEGEVVRRIETNRIHDNLPGLGVRFDNFLGDSQKRLEKYILKSQNDDPKMVYYL